jgi:hypothetical protein
VLYSRRRMRLHNYSCENLKSYINQLYLHTQFTFRKLDVFRLSSEGRDTSSLLCPLERAKFRDWERGAYSVVSLRKS